MLSPKHSPYICSMLLMFISSLAINLNLANAVDYTVLNTADSGPGSLREAIETANVTIGVADTILFDSALNAGIITLATPLGVTDDLTIQGPGADLLTLSGGSLTQVLKVLDPSVSLSLDGLTIADGVTTRGFGTPSDQANGGGIYNAGTLTVSHSTISGNTANQGGGIYSSGTSTVSNSVISGNTANEGAGIFTQGTLLITPPGPIVTTVGGRLTVSNTEIVENEAGRGEGIYNRFGTLTVTHSTISRNTNTVANIQPLGVITSIGQMSLDHSQISENEGRGIFATGLSGVVSVVSHSTIRGNTGDGIEVERGLSSLIVTNTRISENGAGIRFHGKELLVTNSTISGHNGWGIRIDSEDDEDDHPIGNATITHSTISGNSGGGIEQRDNAQTTLSHTLLANAGGNYRVAGVTTFILLNSQGYNLVDDNTMAFALTAPGDQHNVDILSTLGPLQDNGGPTFTHALLAGSPAIDAGDPAFDATDLPFDQRGVGFPRISSGRVEIGAYEFQNPNTAPVANAGGPYLGAVNTAMALDGAGSFDPEDDLLTYAWDFGDGGSGTGVAPSHSYTEVGIYTVCLRVNDGALNSVAPSCTMAVVYDPSGGFVSGGGWITSPVNLDYPYMQVGGKATFGFVAKYKNGANVPEGNTQFQFNAGDLKFSAMTYEWLVVASNKAQFKGEGTINGQGSYKFMLSADDGTPDTFRIHIWEDFVSGGEVTLYDNGSQQPLGGGSIKVHK